MATTIKTGARSTADLSTNRLVVDIGAGISLLDPNENPMTYISQKVGTVVAKQPKHSWLEDVLQPETDLLNISGGYQTASTSLVVDNGTYFSIGDLVRVVRTGEIMHVTGVSTNTLTVTRNYPAVTNTQYGYNVALNDDEPLFIFASVSEEGATSPTAKSTVETQANNYCQIFRTPFDVTETERNSLQMGEQDLPYQTRKKGIEHARKLEYAFKFGLPGSTMTGSGGKPARTTGGMLWFIRGGAPANQIVSQAELTEAEFTDWVRNCFLYGSGTKVLYAAPLIISAIEKWGLAKLNLMTGANTYGLNITKWVSAHGTLAIVNDKMLATGSGSMAFIIDQAKVKYSPLRNRDTKLLTDRQANDADKYTAEYLTECTMELKIPSCHGVLYDVTSSV